MPSFKDLYFKFDEDTNIVSYKIDIDSTRSVPSDAIWNATGTNYTISSMSGHCGSDITFHNRYLTDGISTWKVWSVDDPSKYITITLDRYNTNDSEGKESGVSVDNASVVATLLNNPIPCNQASLSVQVSGYKSAGSEKTDMTLDDIVVSCSDFNGLGLSSSSEDNTHILTYTFSGLTNNGYYAEDVTNKINFVYVGDTSIYDTIRVVQSKPIKRHVFSFTSTEGYEIIGTATPVSIGYVNDTELYPYEGGSVISVIKHGTEFGGNGIVIEGLTDSSVTITYDGPRPYFTRLTMTCMETNGITSIPVSFFEQVSSTTINISMDDIFKDSYGIEIEYSLRTHGDMIEKIYLGKTPFNSNVNITSAVISTYIDDIASINVVNVYKWDSDDFIRLGEGKWAKSEFPVMKRTIGSTSDGDSTENSIETELANPITTTFTITDKNNITFNFTPRNGL